LKKTGQNGTGGVLPKKIEKKDLILSWYSCQTHKLKPILICYIYHQNEKGKLCEMDLPLFKNDITNLLGPNLLVLVFQTIRTGNMPL
jgi:hypothetical protein